MTNNNAGISSSTAGPDDATAALEELVNVLLRDYAGVGYQTGTNRFRQTMSEP